MKLKKFWPIRKGCMQCRSKLFTMKEKVTRTCTSCASRALDGFQEMSEGKFKSGFKKVVSAGNLSEEKERVVKDTVSTVMSRKSKKVEKRVLKECKKQGLNQDEARAQLEGLKDFGKD